MTPYMLMLVVGAVAAIASMSVSKRYALAIAVPAYSLLLLFMGLRDHVSGDWDMYQYFFNVYSSQAFSAAYKVAPTEIGYAWINWAVGHATGNLHLMQLTITAVMLAGLWRLADCFDIDRCLALFLASPYLLFVVGMGYNRQAVAIGFAFMAIAALREKKNLQFLIFLVLATVCHTSAPIFLVLMWANSLRRAMIGAVAVVFATMASLQQVAVEKFQGYYVDQITVANGVWFRLGIFAFGLWFLWVQRRRWAQDPETYEMLKRSAIFLLIAAVFAHSQSTLVDRFCLYFFFAYIVTLGRVLQYIRADMRWVVTAVLFAESFGVAIIWFKTSFFAYHGWIPYRVAFY